jgi:hypothetical protein
MQRFQAAAPDASVSGKKLTVRLLLESTLALDGQFGSHLVGWAWPSRLRWSMEMVDVESRKSSNPFFGGQLRGLGALGLKCLWGALVGARTSGSERPPWRALDEEQLSQVS